MSAVQLVPRELSDHMNLQTSDFKLTKLKNVLITSLKHAAN